MRKEPYLLPWALWKQNRWCRDELARSHSFGVRVCAHHSWWLHSLNSHILHQEGRHSATQPSKDRQKLKDTQHTHRKTSSRHIIRLLIMMSNWQLCHSRCKGFSVEHSASIRLSFSHSIQQGASKSQRDTTYTQEKFKKASYDCCSLWWALGNYVFKMRRKAPLRSILHQQGCHSATQPSKDHQKLKETQHIHRKTST